MAETVQPEDRLFSLVLTLLASEHGLTKQQIFATVRGYEPISGSDTSAKAVAQDKKFERDKTDLRDLGIPIETFDSPEAPGDNQLLRYRITKDDYEFPDDVTFTGAELALLDLAGQVWREGTVSVMTQHALLKLRSFDIEPDAPILGYAPRLRTREASFDTLSLAIERNERVTFEYLKPTDSSAKKREVTPYALGTVEGRWHLLGYDHAREAERTFLLSRIISKVQLSADPATPIPDGVLHRLTEGLQDVYERNVAEVKVRMGSATDAQLSNRLLSKEVSHDEHWRTLQVHFLDPTIFAHELAGSGPEVVVLTPVDVRTSVQQILTSAVVTHSKGVQ